MAPDDVGQPAGSRKRLWGGPASVFALQVVVAALVYLVPMPFIPEGGGYGMMMPSARRLWIFSGLVYAIGSATAVGVLCSALGLFPLISRKKAVAMSLLPVVGISLLVGAMVLFFRFS
jgi:hypothetical protein